MTSDALRDLAIRCMRECAERGNVPADWWIVAIDAHDGSPADAFPAPPDVAVYDYPDALRWLDSPTLTSGERYLLLVSGETLEFGLLVTADAVAVTSDAVH